MRNGVIVSRIKEFDLKLRVLPNGTHIRILQCWDIEQALVAIAKQKGLQ